MLLKTELAVLFTCTRTCTQSL